MEFVLAGLQLDICLLYIDDVIAYASKIMSRTQTYNSVTKKELLAVVTFVEQFRPCLYRCPFTEWTMLL